LPSVYRNNEGTVYFTAHRWSDDRSEILTDVSYSDYTPYNMADYETGSVLQEDYRVSRIRQDNDGRLISADITWKSNFGEEAFCYNGHTFDDKGCLMFVSATYEDSDYFEEFVHNYGSDGRISGYDYYIKNGSEVPALSERVVVESEEYISFSNALKEDKFEYTGDGCYRMEISGDYGTNWYEIELDENGKISQYSWHMGVSGMTYIEKIEYKEMPLTEYEGTPVCYSDLYPLFRINALGDESYVKNAGELQVPLAAKLFFDMY